LGEKSIYREVREMRKAVVTAMVTGLLFVSACATSATPSPEPTAVPLTPTLGPAFADVPYVPDGSEEQRLDIYLPEEAEGRLPAILLIHGAGMSKHESRVLSLASFAVEHGYAGIAIDYGMGLGAAEPKHLEDTFCALAWIYANADGYGLDRERVVVFGTSLGGRIAANLGVVDDASLFLTDCPHQLTEADSVQGVVTFGGPFGTPGGLLEQPFFSVALSRDNDIPGDEMSEMVKGLLDVPPQTWREGGQLDKELERIAQQLPLYWVDVNAPPFLLMHGAEDTDVPPLESENLAAVLEDLGVQVELVLLPDTGHNKFSNDLWQEPLMVFLGDVFGE
jgi:acetyl esterase/lipase